MIDVKYFKGVTLVYSNEWENRHKNVINIDFKGNKVLIIGKNAQGKTNILESIYLLSDLKSPRTSVMCDLIKFDTNEFNIDAVVEKNNTDILYSDCIIIYFVQQ